MWLKVLSLIYQYASNSHSLNLSSSGSVGGFSKRAIPVIEKSSIESPGVSSKCLFVQYVSLFFPICVM